VGWSVSVLPGVVLMAIPIHSNFLLFVAAEAFFCIRLHVGPQLSCCSGMVGWLVLHSRSCMSRGNNCIRPPLALPAGRLGPSQS